MLVQTSMPLHDHFQMQQWLQQQMPDCKVTTRGRFVIVGNGLVTGVQIKPTGNMAKLQWAFPNIGVQIVLTLLIVLSLLPGLIIFLIVWLACKGGIDQLKQRVAGVLQGQAQQGYGSQQGYGQAPQGGYGQAPQGGYGQAPQGGYGQAPQGGYGQAPQAGYAAAPQAPPGGQGWGQGGQGGQGWGGQ